MNPTLTLKRAADGSVHVQYATQSHTTYVPIPMNAYGHHHQSLTSYGAKPQHESQSPFAHLSTPMSQSYSTSSLMHPPAPFSSSLPTSLSAPIPIRRHTLPHIAYPEYGREESYDETHSQAYDGSIQSPVSVQSPNERSFSEGEYEPNYTGMGTPFRGATGVIEPGVSYQVHHSRGHAQEGSDGSNAGWRTVAANVIDWSGRAHGGHSRDSSSGSTQSNATAVGEQPSTIPYAQVGRSHPDYPVTPRSGVSGYVHCFLVLGSTNSRIDLTTSKKCTTTLIYAPSTTFLLLDLDIMRLPSLPTMYFPPRTPCSSIAAALVRLKP
jgi:hypothetical protein